MARYMYSISDAAIDERLDLAYKQADEYLNKVIAAHKAKKNPVDIKFSVHDTFFGIIFIRPR
jgi:hypothetical protein